MEHTEPASLQDAFLMRERVVSRLVRELATIAFEGTRTSSTQVTQQFSPTLNLMAYASAVMGELMASHDSTLGIAPYVDLEWIEDAMLPVRYGVAANVPPHDLAVSARAAAGVGMRNRPTSLERWEEVRNRVNEERTKAQKERRREQELRAAAQLRKVARDALEHIEQQGSHDPLAEEGSLVCV